MAKFDKGKTHSHLNGDDDNKIQAIMPPPDEGSPYRMNETNIDAMDVVPKASNVERVAKAVQQGYTLVSKPSCEKGIGPGVKESYKPWKPRGRKG